MTTHPKYPHDPRDTRRLLGSLVIAAIMLVLVILVTN
jgi:hypothetical protein